MAALWRHEALSGRAYLPVSLQQPWHFVPIRKPIAEPVSARPNKPTSTTLITASGEGHTHVSASH